MNLISVNFLIFITGLIVLYYVVPKKWQWPLLLVASLVFYCLAGVRNVIFILITSATTYLATRYMQDVADKQKVYLAEHKEDLTKEEKSAIKKRDQKKRKAVLVCTLLLNFGILCSFKYIHFAIEQVNVLIQAFGGVGIVDTFAFLIPLGISYYTFQTMGYTLDVYWKKATAERNPLKVLLFTSFFPQITQGPISNFNQLTGELFAEHRFNYKDYSWGIQRMIWGFFKKMCIANVISGYTAALFANYGSYSGLTTLLCMFLYSVQIYADFSGYMDIMCGLCQILGIKLTENFNRPYFSKDVAEYWRRWHMSLCSWFKTYLYYPIAVAKWNQHLGRFLKTKLGGKVGKACGDYLPATLSLVVVWLLTGLWHGATWGYVVWGGVNGLLIILALWMENFYTRWKRAWHVNEQSRIWDGFRVIRTFTTLTFVKLLPEVGTLAAGFGLWAQVFCSQTLPTSIAGLFPYIDASEPMAWPSFAVVIFGIILMFVISMLQRKQPFRELFGRLPLIVRVILLGMIVVLIVVFGVRASWSAGGFMYANF